MKIIQPIFIDQNQCLIILSYLSSILYYLICRDNLKIARDNFTQNLTYKYMIYEFHYIRSNIIEEYEVRNHNDDLIESYCEMNNLSVTS